MYMYILWENNSCNLSSGLLTGGGVVIAVSRLLLPVYHSRRRRGGGGGRGSGLPGRRLRRRPRRVEPRDRLGAGAGAAVQELRRPLLAVLLRHVHVVSESERCIRKRMY